MEYGYVMWERGEAMEFMFLISHWTLDLEMRILSGLCIFFGGERDGIVVVVVVWIMDVMVCENICIL